LFWGRNDVSQFESDDASDNITNNFWVEGRSENDDYALLLGEKKIVEQ
jgi:hypothetical protein